MLIFNYALIYAQPVSSCPLSRNHKGSTLLLKWPNFDHHPDGPHNSSALELQAMLDSPQ